MTGIAAGVPDLFSIVIPARNEAENLQVVVPKLVSELERAGIDHEILVVNDGSTDDHSRDSDRARGSLPPHVRLSKIQRRTDLAWPYMPA